MSEKRRDQRNRILRNGESQRKDGRYVFKYRDINGQPQFVYSWRLEPTDRLPAGKRDGPALRELEPKIIRDLEDKISPRGGDMTVIELVQKYLRTKTGVRASTRAGYKTVLNYLEKDSFSGIRIDRVKQSDAKVWLIDLQKGGKSYSSIHSIRGVLRPAFQMAVDDDLLRKNPFDFELASVIVDDSVTREAISRKDERIFLDFIRNDKHYSEYYDGMCILFKTGLRISEFAGLTLNDVDLRARVSHVDHQLQRTTQMEYIIEDPKTESGIRDIPMTDEVYDCFSRIIAGRPKPKVEPFVGGKTGFLFLDKNGKPKVALHWEKYFHYALEKYNRTYKVQLPKITPHVCRHTFCSNMAKSGMNPKTLQYLMGHSDISITMNTYTHIEFEDARDEVVRVCSEQLAAKNHIQRVRVQAIG